MLKKISSVFILAFVLNLAWEFAHSPLYAHYRGGAITPFILARAAVADAVMISILVFFAQKIAKRKTLFAAVGGLVLAIAIELWALKTGRWAYSVSMPLVPIFKVGLSPALQLAVTGCIALKLLFKKRVFANKQNQETLSLEFRRGDKRKNNINL